MHAWRAEVSIPQTTSGFAPSGNAKIYYETAGAGQPIIMIHAGVADSRQWDALFPHLAQRMRVVRYDMRGYGKSVPVDGEFSHLGDLLALLAHLELHRPLVIMGCSMGGGLAIDVALTHPASVQALIVVDSGPSGLELDVETPAKFAEAEQAYTAGDLDRVAELETQIWFDGMNRAPSEVNQTMRALAYEMNRHALSLDAQGLGKRLPDTQTPAAERLQELDIPVLVIVGAQDTPYMLAAADYMLQHIRSARKVIIDDAAHLPNMDQPDEFQRVVTAFLDDLAK
jgi:pimeloyl-ACP methyl ester carboxylesterase